MKICVFGAGAIGGHLAMRLHKGGADVSLVARGAHLAAIQEMPPAIAFGSIAVPLSALRVAKAQFEALAAAFEKSGNIVSQAMCEASASNLECVILDSGIADDQSQHAA